MTTQLPSGRGPLTGAMSPADPRLEADGHFRVEDVPPGTYTLEVHYHDSTATTTGSARCRGVLQTTVTVEPAAENAVTNPVNLGQLRVLLRSEPLEVRERVPANPASAG